MENQHRKITGYRDLAFAEVELMNAIKAHMIATEALINRVNVHLGEQLNATMPTHAEPRDEFEQEIGGTECIDTPEQTVAKSTEKKRINAAQPWRWLAIATTDFQTAGMALTRAVAQPSTF